MAQKLVSIVITTRNRKEVVSDCITSVLKIDHPSLEVVVVDNGSTDGTVETLKKRFPEVNVIASEENLGLNGGKNLGQKHAKGDYIFFLDSDTIVDEKCLSELVDTAESGTNTGIVTPKMYYFDTPNIIWYAGARVNLLTSQTKNLYANEEDGGQGDQVRETGFAPTAYLTTREVVDRLEGHDELLFMTYGDTDYGFRAKEAGFKVMFCPKAKLWHRINMEASFKTIRGLGYNLPMRAYYFARNRVIFMKRHAPKLNFIIFIFLFFPAFTLYFTYKIIRFNGGWRFLKPHLHGSLDGLRYAFGGKVKNIWR